MKNIQKDHQQKIQQQNIFFNNKFQNLTAKNSELKRIIDEEKLELSKMLKPFFVRMDLHDNDSKNVKLDAIASKNFKKEKYTDRKNLQKKTKNWNYEISD